MPLNEVIVVTVVAAAIMAGVYSMEPAPPAMTPLAVPVSTTALPLDRDDPAATRVGDLVFMGAVQIRSSNPDFGGISGLRPGAATTAGVVPFLAVTDTGRWLSFDAVEAGGRLVGVRNAVLVPIAEPGGGPAPDKAAGDAEALDWNPATGKATVVYEQNHRIAHFAGIDPARPASLATPPTRIEGVTAMAGWPLNGGGEAMAILPGGARIVIGERARRSDNSHVALLTQDGVTREIGIASIDKFSPTDAVAIDATRILLLHRRFKIGVQATAVSLVDLAPALAGAPAAKPLPIRVLARWKPPLTLDNMEGIAVRREGDRLFVYLISDDNLNSLQRTILMKFEAKL
jgi:hypothetical protein